MASTKQLNLDKELQQAIDLYRARRPDEAVSRLQRLSVAFPREARLWGYLGFLNKQQGRLAAAIRCFRRAVNISPRSEKASLGLFHSLWRAGKANLAFDEMRRFMKTGEPRQYLQLLRDMLADEIAASGDERLHPVLGPSELREIERTYLGVEHGNEKVVALPRDPEELLELSHA
jgi:tetratricopeptide (TPR) repeat protein